MILSFLLSQMIPVSLPEFDLSTICHSERVCEARETSALERLRDSWPQQPDNARAHCAARAITGEVTGYAGLEACLIIYRVLGDQDAQEPTQARITLAPVIAERN